MERDLEWLKRQQEGWQLNKRRFKKLPQLLSKTLNRFLQELKVQYRTKGLIKIELTRQEHAKEYVKSLKTTALKTLYEENNQDCETRAELLSRERRAMIGKLQTCSDVQLSDYIRSLEWTNSWKDQHNVKVIQNVMQTRQRVKPTIQADPKKPTRRYRPTKVQRD